VLINYADRIKQASQLAYSTCENESEEYNIFTELERRAIELEEIETDEQKLKLTNLQKIINGTFLNNVRRQQCRSFKGRLSNME
jgi:hypothetical protein